MHKAQLRDYLQGLQKSQLISILIAPKGTTNITESLTLISGTMLNTDYVEVCIDGRTVVVLMTQYELNKMVRSILPSKDFKYETLGDHALEELAKLEVV